MVDGVVKQMLKESYDKAKEMLNKNQNALKRIAAFLVEKETITGKEFMRILREVQNEAASKEVAPEIKAEPVDAVPAQQEVLVSSETEEVLKAAEPHEPEE